MGNDVVAAQSSYYGARRGAQRTLFVAHSGALVQSMLQCELMIDALFGSKNEGKAAPSFPEQSRKVVLRARDYAPYR